MAIGKSAYLESISSSIADIIITIIMVYVEVHKKTVKSVIIYLGEINTNKYLIKVFLNNLEKVCSLSN